MAICKDIHHEILCRQAFNMLDLRFRGASWLLTFSFLFAIDLVRHEPGPIFPVATVVGVILDDIAHCLGPESPIHFHSGPEGQDENVKPL